MERKYRITAAVCFGLMATALSPATDLLAQPIPTDHFKCYVANELENEKPFPIDLEDQFGEQPGVLVHNAGWFCNPTAKLIDDDVTPIFEPNNHLTFYPISKKDPEPRRLVTVENQFGTQELVLTAPRLVAVPTQKDELPPAQFISHFLCYEARAPAIHVTVTLRDQFQEEDVDVLGATFFCNPAAKTVDEVTIGPQPDEDHLTCYKFAPSRNPDTPAFVDISNQFEEDTLKIGPSQYLCLPSEKLGVESGGRNPELMAGSSEEAVDDNRRH
jgi:hypothetical protein